VAPETAPAGDGPRAVELRTAMQLYASGRLGETPDTIAVTVGCDECDHGETVHVDMTPTLGLLARHKIEHHPLPANRQQRRRPGLVGPGGAPLTNGRGRG